MKRHNIFWCMAAVMLLASCTAMEMEPDFQNPEGESDKLKQTITINAVTVDDNADTRAIHGTEENQTSFSWQAGIDKIGVIKGADEYGDGELIWGMDHHRFTNTQDGQIATFVYDIDEEKRKLRFKKKKVLRHPVLWKDINDIEHCVLLSADFVHDVVLLQ